MKKLVLLLIIAALLIVPLAGCGGEAAPPDRPLVRVGVIKGPTGLGAVKLMEDNETGRMANNYGFTVVNTPDEMVAKLTTGEVDIAAMPVNLAANLYQKNGGSIQLISVVALGNLFVLEKGETVNGINDLSGKELLSFGQGATPEYMINTILDQNGLKDSVTVRYGTEHAAVVAEAVSGKADFVVLPEPFASILIDKDAGFRIAIDLTTEWETVYPGEYVTMGGLVARKAFIESNPEALGQFMEDYKASTRFLVFNPVDGGVLTAKFGLFDNADIASKAIPNAGITYIDSDDDMSGKVLRFFELMYSDKLAAIGGKMPDEGFFYKK